MHNTYRILFQLDSIAMLENHIITDLRIFQSTSQFFYYSTSFPILREVSDRQFKFNFHTDHHYSESILLGNFSILKSFNVLF